MSVRAARVVVGVIFALYLLAITWPGVLPFNRIRPLVFGLPFPLFWMALWVVLGGAALWLLHAAERRARRG